MKIRAGNCIALAVCLAAVALAEEPDLREPGLPGAPEVEFTDPHEYPRSAEIELAGGGKITGTVFFGSLTMGIRCRKGDATVEVDQEIGRIRSLHITGWTPKKYGRDRYIFNPTDMTLRPGEGEALRCSVPRELRSLRIHDGTRRRRLFTFFYDAWEGKGWRNAGKDDFSYPMEHPLQGTAVKIIFR